MGPLDDIVNEGFSLADHGGFISSMAIFSLDQALKSYFSTYQSMKYQIHILKEEKISGNYKEEKQYFSDYFIAFSETIIHFQHFVELTCKEILSEHHPLLSVDATKNIILFDKLLNKEEIEQTEWEKINTVEFSIALERLCKLIREGRINKQYEFFIHHKNTLIELNKLRNRLLHKGTYILKYKALDLFVGKYILPFIKEIVTLPTFKSLEMLWKYKKLDCGIDPMEAIIDDFKKDKYDFERISILKELGRAAYVNPLHNSKWILFLKDEQERRTRKICEFEMQMSNGVEIRKCPVCGLNSLVIYEDVETEYGTNGEIEYAYRYTYEIKCTNCSFELNNHLKNPSNYGLLLEDYWESSEL